MKDRPGQKIKMLTVDELLGVPAGESAVEIDIDKISAFENHPFKVLLDDRMHELVESVLGNGILTPVIVRPDDEDGYEMISGHRRLYAAKEAGLETIPAFVRELTDDQATIAMVDSNLQRETLLPSEKAFAYKMRYEAMRHQGNRGDLTSSQIGTKLKGSSTSSQKGTRLRADEELAKQVGESRNQVHRYIRLTELTPELLELVDKGRIAIMTAVDISYLGKKVQKWIHEYICDNGVVKSYQIMALRNAYKDDEEFTQKEMVKILNENLPNRLPSHRVAFTGKRLHQFFPAFYTADEMESVIVRLLEKWKKEQEG